LATALATRRQAAATVGDGFGALASVPGTRAGVSSLVSPLVPGTFGDSFGDPAAAMLGDELATWR